MYRRPTNPFLAIPLALLGLSAVSWAIVEWPARPLADFEVLFGASVVGLMLVGFGMALLRSRQVVLDRSSGQIVKSSQFLIWQRAEAHDLSHFDSADWHPRPRNGKTFYLVRLRGQDEVLPLFETVVLDDARDAVREIGEFVGVSQQHWDHEHLEAGERKPAAHSTPAERARSLTGRRPMRCVFRGESKRIYTQGFETLLKLFAGLAGPVGLFLLFSPAMEIQVVEEGDPQAVVYVLGGLFLALAFLFLFGRRGVTIDRHEGLLSLWWGLPFPVWATRRRLSDFSAVRLQRSMEQSASGGPSVVWRVALNEKHGGVFVLLKSRDAEEARTLAEEIAGFAGYPIVESS